MIEENFEVVCFDFINGNKKAVCTKYFKTLEEAIYFENTKGLDYDVTSLFPMNEKAEKKIYD